MECPAQEIIYSVISVSTSTAKELDIRLLQGNNNTLNPLGTATRAEVAQVLQNFDTIFADA